MVLNNTDDKTLRKYLLGRMSQEEQEALELWLMSDPDAYDLLEAAEDDLIDDSLAGRLHRDELKQFNDHFLAAAERKRKLRFGQGFRTFLTQTNAAVAPAAVRPMRISFSDLLRARPAFAYAGFALIILIYVGGFWAVYRIAQLHHQVDSATSQLALAREAFQRRLEEDKAAAEKSLADFRALEQVVAKSKISAAPEMLLAVNLLPGISRSSTDVRNITISARTQLVQFSVILLDDNYQAYRVALQDDGGQELWTRDRLPATTTADGKAVVLTLPADRLATGDYSIRLSGLSDSNPPQNIASYHFHASRQVK
jgi:hypothetical protein